MTGSRLQLYNGIALLAMFFSCRLIYGNYMSTWVYRDMWNAVWEGPSAEWIHNPAAANDPSVRAFATGSGPIPLWLFILYTTSNIILNSLNVHWFFKMITAVRKRFEPGAAASGKTEKEKAVPAVDGKAAAASGAEATDGTARHRTIVDDLLRVEDDLTEIQ